MPAIRAIRTPDDAASFLAFINDMPMPYRVSVMQGDGRTGSQNSLLHKWFGEVARQQGDRTLVDVKGECHRMFGLAIRLQEPQFSWVWERTGALMDYDKQCKFLASGILSVSSGMTVKQLTTYMDAMQSYYRGEGVVLTDPEDLQ